MTDEKTVPASEPPAAAAAPNDFTDEQLKAGGWTDEQIAELRQTQAKAAAAVPPPPADGAPVQMPGAAAQAPVAMPAQPVEAAEVDRPQEVGENWPEPGYDGPQPFEVETPPELTHDRGLVTSGSAGPAVAELAACLAHLGIGTAISEGKNVHMVFGPTEVAAVDEFRRSFGVEEDPSIVRSAGDSVVGPWTWEALFRAVRKAGG